MCPFKKREVTEVTEAVDKGLKKIAHDMELRDRMEDLVRFTYDDSISDTKQAIQCALVKALLYPKLTEREFFTKLGKVRDSMGLKLKEIPKGVD